jgi:hypothetical protein
MNYFFNIILFIIILFNVKLEVNPIVIPFESTNKKELSPEKYFDNLFNNELKITLKVGSHRQSIPCYLNLNMHTVYICGSDSELKNGQPKYEEYKSETYVNTSGAISSESFYVVGKPSKDEICINDNQITDLKFYLAKTRFSSNELIYSCMIGLGYEEVFYDDDDAQGYLTEIESFLSQLKNNKLINKKVFFIKYNDNDDNGEIIFGAFPHELKDKYCENCIEEEYIEADNIYTTDIQIVWSIKGYIYSGEKLIFNYLSSIDFELNQGFIIGSYLYKKDILNNFFNEKISKEECFTQEIYQQKRAFDGFYCKKDIDITKFESLKIILDKIKYKIEFTFEDLFTMNGDYVYFNVLFTQEEDEFKNDFILGKPVFKKYPMVFNLIKRGEKIGFYNNLSFNKNRENINNINNDGKGSSKKLTIILIIIGIIIISLLIFIIHRYCQKPRKQKVNELIEFFDYSSKQEKI